MKTYLISMALGLALVAVDGRDEAQAQPQEKQAEKKGAMKGDQEGQGMMSGA
jgi:hypothetical protein